MSVIYGQPITLGGGGSEPELLWTNASPTSVPTSLALQFSGTWDAYFVESRFSTLSNGGNLFVSYLVVSKGTSQGVVSFSEAKPATNKCGVRLIDAITNSSITFKASQYLSDTIPTRIWGVKFTL